ncbi:MAG: OmpA family protein [Acidobacteria bacterium]|nr:OmpA family protein [Acidobacteriota bacterium]HQZ38557.1 OmpA family protein [Vicinamibacterales bacterium]
MRKQVMVFALSAATLAVAPACATKGFVRESVGEVNEKVTTLGKTVEETQERVRQNEQKIGEVDSKAAAANSAASSAQKSAEAASGQAQEVGKRADARSSAIEAETRKLIFETVISEDSGKFKFGAAELPDEAKAAIDQMVNQLKADKKAVWIEIEGHTDSVGDAKYNEKLGMERAEAVKKYLYEQHQVPLHKMNTISYGEDKPASDNKTRDGRAQNRRVVIKVLA